MTGRWYCRGCDGILAFTKNLKHFRGFQEFRASLAGSPHQEQLACPACTSPMLTCEAPFESLVYEVDRCPTCESYWFDPGELRLVSGANETPLQQLTNSSDDVLPNSAHFAMAYLKYMTEQEVQRARWLKAFAIFGVVTDLGLLVAVGSRAIYPFGAALSSLILFSIFYFRPRWAVLALAGVLFLFGAVFIWLATF